MAVRHSTLTCARLRFMQAIHLSDEIEVVWVDRGLHERAMRLLAEREDKRWTLCDAVSFDLMRGAKIGEALTTDHNFEQAGFIRLLDR